MDWNKRQKAYELYVYQGLTLESAAREAGIALSTIKRWARDGRESPDKLTWMQTREGVARDRCALTDQMYRLWGMKVERAMMSENPADTFAALGLGKALLEQKPKDETADRKQKRALEIKRLATQIEKQNLENENLKQKIEKAEASAKGTLAAVESLKKKGALSPEGAEAIRKNILYGK